MITPLAHETSYLHPHPHLEQILLAAVLLGLAFLGLTVGRWWLAARWSRGGAGQPPPQPR